MFIDILTQIRLDLPICQMNPWILISVVQYYTVRFGNILRTSFLFVVHFLLVWLGTCQLCANSTYKTQLVNFIRTDRTADFEPAIFCKQLRARQLSYVTP